MPRKNLAGTFEGQPAYRWKKMVKGQVFVLLCRAKKPGEEKENTGWLGLPEEDWTKERSQPAANRFWERKLADPYPDVEIAPETMKFYQDIKTVRAAADLLGIKPEGPAYEHPAIQALKANVDYIEIVTPAVPSDKQLGKKLENFLAQEKIRMKPQSFKELAVYLGFVKDKLGITLDCSLINEDTVNEHYVWLDAKPWDENGKKKRLGFFRRFISWLAENRVCPLPLNLKSKLHRWKPKRKKVKTFSGVKAELDQLDAKLRLWALLGLNCGMTQADMGALRWEQINLTKATLTRVRVKTESQQEVPEVCYKLFPETLALLKALPNKSGLVFTTDKGQPLYTVSYDGAKVKKKDLFSTYWNRQTRKPIIPLGKYRSIGSTCIKKTHRGFTDYFLGHAPASLADRHYAGESDEPFFEALNSLHSQIFESN